MPVAQCPQCRFPYLRWLSDRSNEAVGDYYRCYGCGHVWAVPKNHSGGPAEVELPDIVVPPCPRCDALTGRHIEATSRGALANFFRCAVCGNVWAVPKNPAPPPDGSSNPKK